VSQIAFPLRSTSLRCARPSLASLAADTALFSGVKVSQPRANFNGGAYYNYVHAPTGGKKCAFIFKNPK
jgi:hypothetical protein